MQVLVTGATGFTGRYLTPLLAKAGCQVQTLDTDLTDASAVALRLQQLQPQAIIHLAAISFVPNSTGAQVYHVNVIGTENLLQAAAALPVAPQRIILASSSHVYGQNPMPSEADCPAPINHYGASKLAMEHIANTWRDKLNIIITRPFTYTGVGQPDHYLLPKLIKHFRARSPRIELGNRDLARDFSDVRWIAQAYVALLTQPVQHSLYNLCSGVSYSLHSVLDVLSQHTGHRPELITNPDFVRANDILQQQGDNQRLLQLPTLQPPIPLADTLGWMLSQPA